MKEERKERRMEEGESRKYRVHGKRKVASELYGQMSNGI